MKTVLLVEDEYQTVFTSSAPEATAKTSDKVYIAIPDGWDVGINCMEETLIITPEGETFLAEQIIRHWGDNPYALILENRRNKLA